MFPTWLVPSRSQGKPVICVRANSIATHRNGIEYSARRIAFCRVRGSLASPRGFAIFASSAANAP